MDCIICCKTISESCIPSCSHHFCYTCISKWCKNNINPQCPICRLPIRELKFDPEFDNLINIINKINNKNEIKYINKFINNRKIIIDFNNIKSRIPIGITLKNNKGPGVIVTKVIKNNMAYYSGFNKNDIILFINNIECTNHKHCINILENFQLNNKSVNCILLN